MEANDKKARVVVDCAVSNSGAGALSLKPQGLLRIYLGGANYFDVELGIETYGDKGNLAPRSSAIMRLSSQPLEEMRLPDQDQIKTYFRQNAPATLFLIDINGKVHQSNTVPFARGLYQQSVLDDLRKAASAAGSRSLD